MQVSKRSLKISIFFILTFLSIIFTEIYYRSIDVSIHGKVIGLYSEERSSKSRTWVENHIIVQFDNNKTANFISDAKLGDYISFQNDKSFFPIDGIPEYSHVDTPGKILLFYKTIYSIIIGVILCLFNTFNIVQLVYWVFKSDDSPTLITTRMLDD